MCLLKKSLSDEAGKNHRHASVNRPDAMRFNLEKIDGRGRAMNLARIIPVELILTLIFFIANAVHCPFCIVLIFIFSLR